MAENVLKGRRIAPRARAPKVAGGERTCVVDSCDTRLSRYNKREYCYTHAPVRFPRLRGRIVPEA